MGFGKADFEGNLAVRALAAKDRLPSLITALSSDHGSHLPGTWYMAYGTTSSCATVHLLPTHQIKQPSGVGVLQTAL